MWCKYCDPEFYVVYGLCKNCGRQCEPPSFQPEADTIDKYYELVSDWNKGRDLGAEYARRMRNDED